MPTHRPWPLVSVAFISWVAASMLLASTAWAQFERREAIFYLYGHYNYATQRAYPEFNDMLNIIDIGHAELAERLVTAKGEAEAITRIEEDLFAMVTQMFIGKKRRPRFSPAEETIAPESVKLAWKVSKAFDWTHYLHRQVYDILSDEQVKDKERAIREALHYYLTEPDRAFPTQLKTMELMEGQPFSGYWRRKYPRFNRAIWAYHWLQLAANEALLEPDPATRRKNMERAVAEFKKMFLNPDLLPKHMPMAHEVSPEFAKRFPEVATVFDNLHTFHDIYMDLLTNPAVQDKRAEAYQQLTIMLNPSSHLEERPASLLLPPVPVDRHQPLLQMDQEEHMAMMMLSTEEQHRLLALPVETRKQMLMRQKDHQGMDKKMKGMDH